MTSRTLSAVAIALLIVVAAHAAPVTFQVDVRIPASFGHFEPGVDLVELRGSMNGWGGGAYVLSDPDGDLTYDITVDFVGFGCDTCEDLGKECGTWDDGCSDTVTCGPCSAGFCDDYFGMCVEDACDFEAGCCEGNILRSCAFGFEFEVDCMAAYSQVCGWVDDSSTVPGLPGYFACNGTDTPPDGVISDCGGLPM